MKKITSVFVSFIAAATLTPMTVAAQAAVTCQDPTAYNAPTKLDGNGHYYQAIFAPNENWEDAVDAAALMKFTDPATSITYDGHLAIITTAAEDCFIEKLRERSFDDNVVNGGKPEYWVGAVQEAGNSPAAGWNWINPEAPFDNYTNWQEQFGEPNDFNGTDEMYLGIGHTNTPGWNDEASKGNIGGYIVEFDVNAMVFEGEDLDECLESFGTGCSTTPGGAENITIPDAAIDPDGDPNLRATTYRLTDNPARCGEAPLVLFGGDLIISPNHCATMETGYEFIVVYTETEGIELQEGTIRIVQDAKAALPDFPYTCDQPISLTTSPNDQEVVIYQRTPKQRMREFEETWGPFIDVDPDPDGLDDADGATSDITDSCGTSRARRGENSYSVIGMVQNFGPGTDFENNRSDNFRLWNELVIFKINLLIEAIEASNGTLPSNQYNQILTQAQRTLQKFAEADYSRASSHLRNLLRKAGQASYMPVPGENYQGETIERAGAIKFMIEVKIEPFEAGS